MAEYRTVRMAFWHDPYIEELDAKAKLLYLYLFTGPYCNNLGIVEATRRKIAFETALSVSDIDKYIDEFEAAGKVVCDKERNLIFLTHFIRHQTSTSEKLIIGLKAMLPSISSPIIAKALCIRYPMLYDINLEGMDTVSIPYANGMATLCIPSGEFGIWNLEFGNRKLEVCKISEDGNSSPAPPPGDLDFTQAFQTAVCAEHGNLAPKITEALVKGGAEALEKTKRIDGLEPEEVKSALMWAITDSFWGKNILSMARMRSPTKNGITKIKSVVMDYRKTKPQAQRDIFAGAI